MNARMNTPSGFWRFVTFGTAAALLAGSAAYATNVDVLAIDLATQPQGLVFNWASNPSPSTPTQVTLNFSPTTRTAFTQAAPLQLPCDVNVLNVGMAFRNVGSQAVYPEMAGTVAINGDEHDLLTNAYGQTEPARLWSSGKAPAGR